MNDHQTINVAIVEDDNDMRTAMERLISTTDGFNCVGAFDRCETAIPEIENNHPDAQPSVTIFSSAIHL